MASLSPQFKADQARAEELCRAAKAFLDAKRKVPGHVIAKLMELRHVWAHVDVPAGIVVMDGILTKNLPKPA